jgi:DNA-binding MarR family transcriptional regulator
VSSDSETTFGPRDPISAVYLAYQVGGLEAVKDRIKDAGSAAEGLEGQTLESLSHEKLAAHLDREMRSQSAWTLFFHAAVAERLNLNPTDHKCLDMIWRYYDVGFGACMTPGQLARDTKLTTGAVTGVLDRLEKAGYVVREHDPEDRRRIIIRPVPEHIKANVWPLFDWLSTEFTKLCTQYSEEDLRKMIDFSRRSQELLRSATEHLYTSGRE